jgi:hypothetical protein
MKSIRITIELPSSKALGCRRVRLILQILAEVRLKQAHAAVFDENAKLADPLG